MDIVNYPDSYMNEEWWGLLAIQAGCKLGDPDRLIPRAAYYQVT